MFRALTAAIGRWLGKESALGKYASQREPTGAAHAVLQHQLGLGESFKGHILLLFLIWFAVHCIFSSILSLETYSNGSPFDAPGRRR